VQHLRACFLGHPWGTLATVRSLQTFRASQKFRYHKDFETQETPRISEDRPEEHS
jgi:hypothetical protein